VKDALLIAILSLLPRKAGAQSVGWFARLGLSKLVLRWFVRHYRLQLEEAERPLPEYQTLEDLFTRTLKAGARPVQGEPGAMSSPVDGKVSFVGSSSDGQILLGERSLDLSLLLARELRSDLDVCVLYLAPHNYHRVHAPTEGSATQVSYQPGSLWPVFPAAVARVRNLFARNERVCVNFETENGPLDVVLVGAFGVGRISLSVCDLLTNTGQRGREQVLLPPVRMERGQELGIFHLGSTVILLSPTGRWQWQVAVGDEVRVGQVIGQDGANRL